MDIFHPIFYIGVLITSMLTLLLVPIVDTNNPLDVNIADIYSSKYKKRLLIFIMIIFIAYVFFKSISQSLTLTLFVLDLLIILG
jgi:hypothetical protein